MILQNLKYTTIEYGVGLATLLFSPSCKDFLDRDSEDGKSDAAFQTFADYQSLTSMLYGGIIWSSYNAKFSWAASSDVPGVNEYLTRAFLPNP